MIVSTAHSSVPLFEVGAGGFLTDSLVTCAHRAESGTGGMIGVGYGFELWATDLVGSPVALNDEITVTVNYTDSDLGPAIESSMRLYRLEGTSWVTKGIDSSLDAGVNLLTSLIDRMGRFPVLAETNRLRLPVVVSSAAGGW